MANLDWLGIVLSLLAGTLNFSGTVMQKKVINDLPPEQRDSKFFASLVRKPLWILGLLCQLAFGAALQMIAVALIGPTLTPGLMAVGLVALAIGSVYVIHESLKPIEYFGIAMMLVAMVLLAFSDLEINPTVAFLLDPGFVLRISIFSIATLAIIIGCYLGGRNLHSARGSILVITASGCFFALSNLWISPLMTTITILGGVDFSWGELALFVVSCIFLIMANVFGTGLQQTALKQGDASKLITIQQIPTLAAPVFYYFAVFLLWPPNPSIDIPFFSISIILALFSTLLLARRQVMLEAIQIPPEEKVKDVKTLEQWESQVSNDSIEENNK